MSDKYMVFCEELKFINNQAVKDFTIKALDLVPEYFYAIPASQSGKYHPSYSLGDGGLVRHERGAIRIAKELMRMEEYSFTDIEKDCIFSALFLHDGIKLGLDGGEKMISEHPVVMKEFLLNNDELKTMLPKELLDIISGNIETHMGQWNTNREGVVIMRKPETRMEKFVHLCDYLASRKCLEMNFEVELAN